MKVTHTSATIYCLYCTARRQLRKRTIPSGVSYDHAQAYRWLQRHREIHAKSRAKYRGVVVEETRTLIAAADIDDDPPSERGSKQ